MKKRFVFLSVPAPGHVNPTLPLVQELTRRGHEVTYITGERFADAIESAGATLLARPSEDIDNPPKGPVGAAMFAQAIRFITRIARWDVPTLLRQFEKQPPDAICYDMMSPAALIASEKLRVPAISLIPSFATNEHFQMLEGSEELFSDPEVVEAREDLTAFFTECGVAAPPGLLSSRGSLNIVFVPYQFQPAAETFDDSYRFVGPSLGARGTDHSWQAPTDGKPLLFVSLGTALNDRPDFFQNCLRGFGDTSWRVLMAVGEHVDPAALGPIPDNFEVRPFFPQPAVLQHADVFLSHAGMNSVLESLYCGVPLVLFPQMHEQALNAGRVEELGLGRRLTDPVPTAEVLRKTVEEVHADDSIRRAVSEFRDVARNSGGAVAAADAIEAHLA